MPNIKLQKRLLIFLLAFSVLQPLTTEAYFNSPVSKISNFYRHYIVSILGDVFCDVNLFNICEGKTLAQVSNQENNFTPRVLGASTSVPEDVNTQNDLAANTTGPAGPTGPRGPRGPQGPKGDPGTAASGDYVTKSNFNRQVSAILDSINNSVRNVMSSQTQYSSTGFSSDIVANSFTDGVLTISGGEIDGANFIQASEFYDGVLDIFNGDISNANSIDAQNISANNQITGSTLSDNNLTIHNGSITNALNIDANGTITADTFSDGLLNISSGNIINAGYIAADSSDIGLISISSNGNIDGVADLTINNIFANNEIDAGTFSDNVMTISNGSIFNVSDLAIGMINPTDELQVNGNIRAGSNNAFRTVQGTNVINIMDGTAPSGTLSNGVSLYSQAGELRAMDAAGNSTLLSPHDDPHNYWVFDSENDVLGKTLHIDMEQMMKSVNNTFGLDFVHETLNGVDTPMQPVSIPEGFVTAMLDKISAWLSNATNQITRIFTGEVCLTDPGQDPVCINRSELQALKALAGQSNSNNLSAPSDDGSMSGQVPYPDPTPVPDPAPQPDPNPDQNPPVGDSQPDQGSTKTPDSGTPAGDPATP